MGTGTVVWSIDLSNDGRTLVTILSTCNGACLECSSIHKVLREENKKIVLQLKIIGPLSINLPAPIWTA